MMIFLRLSFSIVVWTSPWFSTIVFGADHISSPWLLILFYEIASYTFSADMNPFTCRCPCVAGSDIFQFTVCPFATNKEPAVLLRLFVEVAVNTQSFIQNVFIFQVLL